MTIDEAIKRYADNADYERTHGNLQGYLEFKQLANWVKELKQLREQEPCEDEIMLTKEEYGQLLSNEFDNGYAKGYREALEQDSILDKLRAEIQKLRGCSCSCSDGIIDDVEDILDKLIESEEQK